jgi:hypothetical protein
MNKGFVLRVLTGLSQSVEECRCLCLGLVKKEDSMARSKIRS